MIDDYRRGRRKVFMFKYRVYWPAKNPNITLLWPIWEGMASGLDQACRYALRTWDENKENIIRDSHTRVERPSPGDTVAVVNVDREQGMTLYTVVAQPLDPIPPAVVFVRKNMHDGA